MTSYETRLKAAAIKPQEIKIIKQFVKDFYAKYGKLMTKLALE